MIAVESDENLSSNTVGPLSERHEGAYTYKYVFDDSQSTNLPNDQWQDLELSIRQYWS